MSCFVSADSHFNEDRDFYVDRLPRKLRDKAPHVVDSKEGSHWKCGNYLRPIGLDNQAGRNSSNLKKLIHYEEVSDVFDLDKREEIVREDKGVVHEVLYPSGAMLYAIKDVELSEACFTAYNDFMVSVTKKNSFYTGITMLPAQPKRAKIEALRLAKEGAKGMLLPLYPGESMYSEGAYDSVFEIAQEANIPISMHAGGLRCLPTGIKLSYSMTGFKNSLLVYHAMETIADLYFSGRLDRFPKLSIVFAEVGVGWIPYFLNRLRYSYSRYHHLDELKVDRPIDEIFKQNLYFTFQFETVADELIEMGLASQLLYGTDFPHAESTHMESMKIYASNVEKLGLTAADEIFRKNTIRLYSIDLEAAIEKRALA